MTPLDVDERMKRDSFYVWFIPLLWCGFTIVSYFHPGDEYGLFAFGSMAGAWLFFFCRFDSLGQSEHLRHNNSINRGRPREPLD